jgi:hypothetical protein
MLHEGRTGRVVAERLSSEVRHGEHGHHDRIAWTRTTVPFASYERDSLTKGLFRLWFGPATKPSTDTAMSDVTLLILLPPCSPSSRSYHRRNLELVSGARSLRVLNRWVERCDENLEVFSFLPTLSSRRPRIDPGRGIHS